MFQRYGFFGGLRVLVSWIYTKIFFSNARLIRLPFDIRSRKFINIGRLFTTGFGCRIEVIKHSEFTPKLVIGNNVQINDYVHIACGESVVIEDNVLIASKVFITDLNHGNYKGTNSDSPLSDPNKRSLYTNPVLIRENSWLGENVCVMPGVTIGKGSIIGAGSVVTKSICDYSIAVGAPAKPIKKYNFESQQWEKIN